MADRDEDGKQSSIEREMHIVAAIEEWNRGLPPVALKKKYAMLGESPMAFYRGTNHLFWADFSGDDRLTKFGNEASLTWISGDCHVDSFRASGSDSEGPMYGLNEFDEAIIADYQYDVWRLAASIVLLGYANDGQCAEEETQKAAVQGFAKRYLRTVVGYKHSEGGEARARLSTLLAYTAGNIKGRLVRFLAIVEREYSRRKLLKKWCNEDGPKYDFLVVKESLQPCPTFEADAVASAFGYYAETAQGEAVRSDGVNVKDTTRRLYADCASCGLPRYYVLTEAGDGELHVLDVKLQQKPTAYHFMRPEERQQYRELFENDAARHAKACQVLSSSQDAFNGWIELKDDIHPAAAGFYSVRDLSPYEEYFPASARDDVKPKFKSFTLTNQVGWSPRDLLVQENSDCRLPPSATPAVSHVQLPGMRVPHDIQRQIASMRQLYLPLMTVRRPVNEFILAGGRMWKTCFSQTLSMARPDNLAHVVPSQEALVELAEDWARILGTQHAHAACVLDPDGVVDQRPRFSREIGQLAKADRGGFEDLVWEIARTYAQQVHVDWLAFRRHLL